MLKVLGVFRDIGPEPRYCLCDDPDYCLRDTPSDYREAAIAYRREHGAKLPEGVE